MAGCTRYRGNIIHCTHICLSQYGNDVLRFAEDTHHPGQDVVGRGSRYVDLQRSGGRP